jgi:hypothetical protein
MRNTESGSLNGLPSFALTLLDPMFGRTDWPKLKGLVERPMTRLEN